MGVRIFFFCYLFFLPILLRAQTFNEWTRQKRTQLRYLVKHITGLQIYIDLAREGYSIAADGLSLIGDFKRGDFSLHDDHFKSLSRVNPALNNLFMYDGPCREEFDRLMMDGYYQLSDDERMMRLRMLIFNCRQ